LYTVVPEGFSNRIGSAEGLQVEQPVTGTSEVIAEYILSLGELGLEEVRCDVWPKETAAVEAMAPIVDIVHTG
jgi:hypothetical protein